jgi:hypothetical protein
MLPYIVYKAKCKNIHLSLCCGGEGYQTLVGARGLSAPEALLQVAYARTLWFSTAHFV